MPLFSNVPVTLQVHALELYTGIDAYRMKYVSQLVTYYIEMTYSHVLIL